MSLALASYHVAILVIAASIFVAAAVNDFSAYRIPNYMCGLLLLLFPLFVLTAPREMDWHQNVMIFGLVALSGFAMFLGHMAGAGDIKLLSVASLWAGAHYVAVLLVVTAIAGGILSLAMMGVAYYRNYKAKDAEGAGTQILKFPIPYGIAIATGGLTMLGMIAQPILLPS